MKKHSIIIWEIIIFLITVVCIFVIQYGLANKEWEWDPLLFNTILYLLLAISSGLSVGIFFEIFVRKKQLNETFEIANLSRELEQAGIKKYKHEFKDYVNDLKELLQSSNSIDMYLTYGGTFFHQISNVLVEAFKKKNCEINIFILSESNPFISGLANLWSKIDQEYNEVGLRKKIEYTTKLLTRLANDAYKESAHAKINIFKLLDNPINFSFYRFDDQIIFCPTKITERKEFNNPALKFSKTNQHDLYNWVMSELSHIKSVPERIEHIFPIKT